ncbi:MAG: hypothetical protein AAFR61_02220 [Bacteroidota bacterium]
MRMRLLSPVLLSLILLLPLSHLHAQDTHGKLLLRVNQACYLQIDDQEGVELKAGEMRSFSLLQGTHLIIADNGTEIKEEVIEIKAQRQQLFRLNFKTQPKVPVLEPVVSERRTERKPTPPPTLDPVTEDTRRARVEELFEKEEKAPARSAEAAPELEPSDFSEPAETDQSRVQRTATETPTTLLPTNKFVFGQESGEMGMGNRRPLRMAEPDITADSTVEMTFDFWIEPDGSVFSVRALPNQHPTLRKEGIETIRTWQFTPSSEDKRQLVRVRMRFTPKD